ncbi:Serine/threonine-protein kinase srk1, partial [Choanephora cucurbitarum]
IRQVAEGILYLHEEKGIVHRDIKPENLLFVPIDFKERSTPLPTSEFDEPKEDEGEFMPGIGGGGIGAVKIADFGLSKVVWDQHTMTPCGTVGYTAPEIVKDQRYSKSVDMWALGCVLYTLLCGFPPFYDESIQVLTEKVAKGQYTFLSPWWDSISDEAKDLVENLLHVDPEKRFTILEFMNHPWMKSSETSLERETKARKLDGLDLTKIPMFTSIESTGETEAEAFKRMIQEHHRDEQELEVATPTLTSSSVINSRVNSRAASRAPSIIASGATTPRRDLFSGVSSMKEMFDISYAVHRMTEEKQRRQQIKQSDTPRRSLLISAVNGLDDMTDDDMTTTDETSSTHDEEEIESLGNQFKATQLQKRQTRSNKDGGLFELNMNNATLLGRRKIPSATEPMDG